MGNSQALVNLALDYQNGNNVEYKDSHKAVELYEKAADLGNPQAQLSLGYCYLEGEGVLKDAAKAKEYFMMAADQGLPAAKRALEK